MFCFHVFLLTRSISEPRAWTFRGTFVSSSALQQHQNETRPSSGLLPPLKTSSSGRERPSLRLLYSRTSSLPTVPSSDRAVNPHNKKGLVHIGWRCMRLGIEPGTQGTLAKREDSVCPTMSKRTSEGEGSREEGGERREERGESPESRGAVELQISA
ncbi:hypothetical protein EYF80_020074 [Liparis tanakae]|uniref:Uncharacterized protein n=1 Tax=Liparis tanakae TaxID=230148 RepID=A0A4Z2HVT0_9TELE|nr:hypothetical protein EYF80_020074 [Liparis tanakae]